MSTPIKNRIDVIQEWVLASPVSQRNNSYEKAGGIEWKRSFSALKIFKIGFIGVPSNIPFFWEICVVNLSWYFFHKWD